MGQYICRTCALERECDDCKIGGVRQNVEACGDYYPFKARVKKQTEMAKSTKK